MFWDQDTTWKRVISAGGGFSSGSSRKRQLWLKNEVNVEVRKTAVRHQKESVPSHSHVNIPRSAAVKSIFNNLVQKVSFSSEGTPPITSAF